MDEPTGIDKVLRGITQAYVEGLSTLGIWPVEQTASIGGHLQRELHT
jgi:hypothetical protein